MIASFKRELDRLYSIRWLAQNSYGKEHISWQSKLKWKAFVQHLGVRVPEVYQMEDKLEDLKEPTQDNWVLKPTKGSANRGVYPCIRKGNGWYSCFNNKKMSWREIIRQAKKTDNVKPPYIIEEFAGDSLPDNWEFYCFDGEIGLIRQRRQVEGRHFEGREHKFWDTDWNDLGELEEEKVYNHDLPLPLNPKELLDTASKISKALPFIFSRIDLYDTKDGVYYGEITMHPGPGNNFPEELDRKLGKMWLKAEARKSEA